MHSGSFRDRPAQRLWTSQCPVISNVAAAANTVAVWHWMCPVSLIPVNLLTGDMLSRQGSFDTCRIRSWNAKPNQENWSVNTEEWSLQCSLWYTLDYVIRYQRKNGPTAECSKQKWWLHLCLNHHFNKDASSVLHVPAAVRLCLQKNSNDHSKVSVFHQCVSFSYIAKHMLQHCVQRLGSYKRPLQDDARVGHTD